MGTNRYDWRLFLCVSLHQTAVVNQVEALDLVLKYLDDDMVGLGVADLVISVD